MCSPFPACWAGDAGEDALGSMLRSMVDSLIDSVTPALTSLGTLWVKIKTPDLTGGGSTAARGHAADADNVLTALGYVTWIGLAVAIIAVIILGAMIATRMRTGEGIAAVGKIGIVLAAVILISSASSIVALILPSGPQGVGGATGYIQASLWWYMAAAAILSVIIGGIRMAWEQRAQPGLDTLKSLITLIVVTGAGVPIIGILIKAADSFSAWVIDGALDCSLDDSNCFPASVAKLLHLSTDSDSEGVGAIASVLVMALIALLALLSTLIQIVLLIARSGMLVILAGVLPIAASATNTDNGKTWFRKCLSWLIGFLLYKPAAAIVYAAAFKLFGNNAESTDDLISMLTGIMLMVLAVFALPAILRFVSPMAAGAAGGTASGAATVAALASMPSGARSGGGGGGAVGGAMGRLSALGSGSGAGAGGGATGSRGSGGSQRGSGSSGSGSKGGSGSTAAQSSAASTGSSAGTGSSGSTKSPGSTKPSGNTKSSGSTGALGTSGGKAAALVARAAGSGAGSGGASSGGKAAAGSGTGGSSGAAGGGDSGSTGTQSSGSGPTGSDSGDAPRGRRYASGGGGSGEGGSSGGGSGGSGSHSKALLAAQLAGGAAQSITSDTTGGGQG